MTDSMPTTVSVTVELPTEAAMRIATAICARRGYGPASPEDAIEFVKQTVFDMLRSETLEHEASIAAQQARDAVYANPSDPLAYVAPAPVPDQPVAPPPAATGATGGDQPLMRYRK